MGVFVRGGWVGDGVSVGGTGVFEGVGVIVFVGGNGVAEGVRGVKDGNASVWKPQPAIARQDKIISRRKRKGLFVNGYLRETS